jgi:hypothetical protein
MYRGSLVLIIGFAALTACADNAAGPGSSRSPAGPALSVSPQSQIVLHVDSAAAEGGDGSGRRPFRTLKAAVDSANHLNNAQIVVAPGTYPVTDRVDVRVAMTILGSNVMEFGPDSLPTGAVVPGTESRILATPKPKGDTLVLVRGNNGGVIRGVKLANLTIQAVTGTIASVLFVKTQGFDVRNTIWKGPSGQLGTSASSGSIRASYFTGAVCGMCIEAGNAGSPSVVDIRGNRAVANGAGGLLLNGAGTNVEEFADQLDATVVNNDFSNNTSGNMGFGIRILVIRRDLNAPVDSQFTGHVRASIHDNRIANNLFGLILDAGFPYRMLKDGTCDPRTYTGELDVALKNNSISGNTKKAGLISFTRASATILFPAQSSQWQYLHNSKFNVDDPDGSLDGYQLDHVANDLSFPPPQCPNDLVSEPLWNQFWYNGV